MNELLVAIGSAVAGLFLFRLLVKNNADKGQRQLEIKTAVIENQVDNLREKQKEIASEAQADIKKLEREKEKELNAEELANWFNDRNKSDK